MLQPPFLHAAHYRLGFQVPAALELLIDKIRATKSNEQFLREISKAPAGD